MAANGNQSGQYNIGSSAGSLLYLKCEMENNKMKTIIPHSISNKLIYVNGYEKAFSYQQTLSYGQNFSGIISIIDTSDECRQLVKTKCYHSMITDTSYLTNRANQRMDYWGGGPPDGEGCACGISRNCAKRSKPCNCDANDYVTRTDDGYVTQKSDLPITSIRIGDTGHKFEFKEYLIGDVECFSTYSKLERLNCPTK